MNPWTDPSVAQQQRALVDEELQRKPWPAQHTALAEAVRATQCPGEILEFGCASGYGREILNRAGVPVRSYAGVDISVPALAIAAERYPDATWIPEEVMDRKTRCADIVVDGCSLMHRVDTWREDLAAMARASRRWVILHRLPCGTSEVTETRGYGHTFPARTFDVGEVCDLMVDRGFVTVGTALPADNETTHTVTFARPRHFATYFDINYMTRALAMWRSLRLRCRAVVMHALCYDQQSYQAAKDAGMYAQLADTFLAGRPDLKRDMLPGPERTRAEWMWSVGPAWIAAIMRTTGEPVTYVDADVRFFSSPEPLFAELGGAPAGVIPHGFAREAQGLPGPTVETHEAPFGRFNVGIVMFNDPAVAEAWADDVKRWCYDRPEGGKYGDQKYLEAWPEKHGAVVIQHPGAMVAPWNIHTRALDVRDGVPYFGNRPIIAYHFSALKQREGGGWDATRPEYQLTARQVALLYADYVRELEGRTP